MNKEDQEQIRKIIREEILGFMRKFYEMRFESRNLRLPESYGEELNRFAFLNEQFSMMIKDAGSLMKGCKYDKKVVDDIAKDVKSIDSKT